MSITLRRRLSPAATPYNLALRGLPVDTDTESVSGEIYWRDANDATSQWQLLGVGKAGTTVEVPFDLKGRTIELSLISKTSNGIRSTNIVDEGVRTTFAIGPPALTSLSFSSPDVTGDIGNNGGVGDISVLRKLSSESAFSVVQTVSASATTFTDTPTINGDYEYKLTQAGVEGESNTLSVTVTGAGGGAGTPPDTLGVTSTSVLDDSVDVTLGWTNHGGTGNNIIEAKIGSSGTWNQIAVVSSGTSTYTDSEPRGFSNYVIYYRVYNDEVIGYSNETHTTILRQ
jgi:hypothetical protein